MAKGKATAPEGQDTPTPRRVRATQMGYYDHIRRREGDVFTIHKMQDYSANWMEFVSKSTPEKITTGLEDLRAQHDRELATRRGVTDDAVIGD